jgi:DNA-binding response OmpR family regulator
MRILVVEDEHKIANSIKKGLEQEYYAVDVAYDGAYGFDLAATEDYDVIVLDLLLPEMDGIEGFNAGADDYLVKPFAFMELLARIKAITRRPKESLGPVLKAGDLTLDTTTYEVKRAGRCISLTRKEYALLEYLLRHKGKILTKGQIIGGVWDYDADILPNTVEVYIGYLRKKIDKPFRSSPSLINTILGFGYRIGE